MAMLKDSVVTGSLRVTDTTYTNKAQFSILNAPTASNGATFGPGSANQVLKSNGTSVYWGADSNAVTGVKGNAESSYRVGNVNLTAQNLGLPLWYGTCTTPAATAIKEVTCAGFPTGDNLTAGTTIFVRFTITNSAAVGDLRLCVNSTAEGDRKPIKCQVVDSIINLPAVKYLAANQTYLFAYDGTNWVMMNVNRDNNDNTYDRTYAAGGANRTAETSDNGGVGIHRYSLQMMTLNQTWSSLSSDYPSAATTNGGATAKTLATCNFLITSPILYQDTNANAAPGGTANVNGFTAIPLDLRYSLPASSWTNLVIQKPVYLIGILTGGTTFKIDSTQQYTQELPSTNDGKIYIYLGLAYTTTNIYLYHVHPIYYYNNGALSIYTGQATSSAYSKIYSAVTCEADNQNKGWLYFGKVNIKDINTWQTPWSVHYRIYVTTSEANTQGWYDCQVSVQGSTICVYHYNNFYSNDYRPLYNHLTIFPKNTYSSYGGYLGIRFQSSRTPTTLARTVKIEILETNGCTVELLNNFQTYDTTFVTTNSIAAGTIWYSGEYNGYTNGLQETGDTNSNDTGTLIRDYGSSEALFTVTAATYRYQLLFSTTDTNYGWKVIPANTTSNNQNTTKTTIFTGEFNIFGDIYYYSHTDTVNANATIRADRVWKTYPINLKYSFNTGATLTVGKDVYLVAKLTSPTTATLRNPGATDANASAQATGENAGPITQILPTEWDGYIYIRLGKAYTTANIDLALTHPIYWFNNGALQQYVPSTGSVGSTIEFIRGTWSSASGTWTGASKDSFLYEGKQIILYMPFAGSGNATLNLTMANGVATGAKNVYFESNNTFTTHKGQNAQLHLIYHENFTLSNGTAYTGWWYLANRDTNDDYRAYLTRFNASIFYTSRVCSYYQILLQKDGKQVIPISTKGNSTADTDTTITTDSFLIYGDILYYAATTSVAAGSVLAHGNVWTRYSLDLRYSFNCGTTLTNGDDVYLVATPNQDGIHATLRNPGNTGTSGGAAGTGPISQTLPSSDDGYIYIRLGRAYSTYQIILTENHPVYWYKDGAIRNYDAALAYTTTTANYNNKIMRRDSNGYAYANRMYNAIWNDYAEYRECDMLPPGTCVQENDNGHLTITEFRLTPGAAIITDTFGYAQGETETAHTPIAVSGRVLAYTYRPPKSYHAGMAVCSAPGGTIDIMTREEIKEYPDAIVGIVSEIPDYEVWGSGNIEVNNRIWIKVR